MKNNFRTLPEFGKLISWQFPILIFLYSTYLHFIFADSLTCLQCVVYRKRNVQAVLKYSDHHQSVVEVKRRRVVGNRKQAIALISANVLNIFVVSRLYDREISAQSVLVIKQPSTISKLITELRNHRF